MSLRLEMLQIARLSPRLLSDSTDLVASYIQSQVHEEGGFCDRAGQSDLYYTVFGLQCIHALQMPIPDRLPGYLLRCAEKDDLDFIHTCALVHSWANLGRDWPDNLQSQLAGRVEDFRSADGGYHPEAGREKGNGYGTFLALSTYSDLGLEIPDKDRFSQTVQGFLCPDGSFCNEPGIRVGTTPTTAAGLTASRVLGFPTPQGAVMWLFGIMEHGGFKVAASAPVPDLLSTATALHALAGAKADLSPIKENCLDFIDSLWVNKGGFYGTWYETYLDVEYTFYGLLALGHLSLL